MTDLSSLLERADQAVSRVPLPTDGLERLRRLRDRKRRNQRIAAGVVGIAVFVASVWMVTTGAPFDRTITPGTNERTVAPDDVGQVGLIGLPPEGATPSAPKHGELVLGLGFGHTSGDAGRFSLHLYADGRLIWQRLGGDPTSNLASTGFVEQRLTPEGVELVRAEVLSTGLFDHDRAFVGAHGLHYGGIEVRAGDRLVQLAWGDAGFEEGIGSVATTPTPEQVRTLEQLDARLEDLASWLPASAWEDPELRAYVPSRYSVCYGWLEEPLGRPGVLDLLPALAGDLLRTLDTTQSYPNGFRGSRSYWCSVVTTEQARELAGILDAGAFKADSYGPTYETTPVQARDLVHIDFGPVLPHE